MDANVMMYAFGIALTLSAIWVSNLSLGRKFSAVQDRDIVAEVEQEFNCEQLRGNLRDESPLLLMECENIMQSDLVKQTKEYMLNLTREQMKESEAASFDKQPKLLERIKRSLTECPVMDANYFAQDLTIGMRSLSPYKGYLTDNAERFPRHLLQSKCLCNGCIHPDTGRETLDYQSQLIEVDHTVFFLNEDTNKYELGREKIRVGCTCIVPNFRVSG